MSGKIYLGNTRQKVFIGNLKVKRGYVGATQIYSSGSTVTYRVDTNVTYVEEVDEGASCLNPTTFTPTKSGWSFVGWREDAVASASVLPSKTMGETPITLYAVFRASVTVTKYDNSTSPTTQSAYKYYNNGNNLNASFTLTESNKTGWSKVGWTTSASGYSATVANGGTVQLSSAATYYSLYSQAVTVTYYNNSATASTSTKNRVVNYHSAETFSNPTFNLGETAVSGWVARGWSTSNTGNAAISYANGTNFTRSSSITLYGLYQRTVTVSYNGNGSTSGATSASTGTAYRNATGGIINTTITLRENGFARTSYTFYRWASAGGTLYRPGDSLSLYADTSMAAYWLATTTNFGYTGGMQSFTAKAGVTYLLQVWGAQGEACPLTVTEGSNVPGYGGWAGGYIAYSADTALYVAVGGMGSSNGTGGYNGGGTGSGWANPPSGVSTISRGSGGGGATHIGLSNAVLASTPLSNVLLAAGGGGAVGGEIGYFSDDDYRWGVRVVNGGHGGGAVGSDAEHGGAAYGTGGTQATGGTNSYNIGSASYGTGGSDNGAYRDQVSGGGAGLYGGGCGYYSGAGGGSGYVGGVSSSSMQNGVHTGHGYASITIASVA